MGDHDFSSELIEYFIRTVDTNELLSFNPIAVQELYAKNLYYSIQSINAKGKVMKGDRDSRFDEIVDVINDARLKGLLPIEISTHEDDQSRPFWYEFMDTGEKITMPPRDFVVTIRFRRQ